MSKPINITRFNALVNQYLYTRITEGRRSSLSRLTDQTFSVLVDDLDKSIELYNSFPACLSHSPYHSDMFINATHLKSIYNQPLPSYSAVLQYLHNNPKAVDSAFSEMRDSTYFHHIYEIDNPEHLLANLLTLVYRCQLLATIPFLRENKAQISSTLEELSALRYLLGQDNLHYRATRHWILDWEGEGFSRELALAITKA